jgi:hypothetical protein
LKIPGRTIKKAAFLGTLEPAAGQLASGVTVNGTPATLWFRMKDVDTVEIVVTDDVATPAQ